MAHKGEGGTQELKSTAGVGGVEFFGCWKLEKGFLSEKGGGVKSQCLHSSPHSKNRGRNSECG